MFYRTEVLSRAPKNKESRAALGIKFDIEFRLIMNELIRKQKHLKKLKNRIEKRASFQKKLSNSVKEPTK